MGWTPRALKPSFESIAGMTDMRAVLEHCVGGTETTLPADTVLIEEGHTTGHLYVLLDGRLEVLKGGTVVATVSEPGAILGEMSVLLHQSHTATVKAATASRVYEFQDAAQFLKSQPAVALLVATMLAQRLNAATTYLADIKRQYAGHGNHLSMVGEILESLVNLTGSRAQPGSDRQPERLPDSRL